MKIRKEELGFYTDLYRLEGKEDRKERYIAYNNILFKGLDDLATGRKQLIVINEVGNGGVIYGSVEHADKALKNLNKALKDKYVAVVAVEKTTKYKKIAFAINNNWKINL